MRDNTLSPVARVSRRWRVVLVAVGAVFGAGAVLLAVILLTHTGAPPVPAGGQSAGSAAPVVSVESRLSIALDRAASPKARLEALHSLPTTLERAQQEALRVLVKTRDEDATIRNDALSVLENQRQRLEGLGADLIAMFRDEQESPRWHDFAVQHMSRHVSGGRGLHTLQTLAEIAKEEPQGKTNYPGTALLALERAGLDDPGIAHIAGDLARKSLDTLSSTTGPEAERAVVAIQVAREAGDKSALPKARELAVDTSALTRLRLSAIAALTELGLREDEAVLERLANDSNRSIARSARGGLQLLRKRLSASDADAGDGGARTGDRPELR